MRTLARIAALACTVIALASCEPAKVHRQSADATRYLSEKVLGVEYDLRLLPAAAAAAGPGALVVTRSRLTFDSGVQIPLSQVAPGVYRTPSLRTRYGAEGSGICGGQPVSYLALHRGPGDLYYLNAGDWATAPSVPGAAAESIPGACETAAYTLGSTGS